MAAPRPGDGQWTPVGYLTRKDVSPDAPPSGPFMFSYVQAAKDNKLPHLWWGTPDWKSLYSSSELPPPFSWRVRSESRKDYGDYLSALDLTREEVRKNLFTLLARTEGRKVTDGIEIFAKPVPKDGRYDIPFFLRGLRHFLESGEEPFNLVSAGSRRYSRTMSCSSRRTRNIPPTRVRSPSSRRTGSSSATARAISPANSAVF